MPSYFESHSNFVPDASQGFNNEFVRLAASQGLRQGTPQFERARTVALTRVRAFGGEKIQEDLLDEEVNRDSEGDLPELNEDDNESVVSLDVGFSQVFTSDPPVYVKVEDSEYEEDPEAAAGSVKEKIAPGSVIKEEPIIDDIVIDLLPLDEGDNESIVSMDQGLTQVFKSSSDQLSDGECHDHSDDDQVKQRDVVPLNELTKEEQLLGWQALCQETGRTIGKTILECRTLLKQKPYINIIDYIDAARLGTKIELFHDFTEFCRYTMTTPGKRVNLQEAKKDEVLSTLLQKVNGSSEDRKKSEHGSSCRQQHPSNREGWRRVDPYRPNGRGSGHSRRHERSWNERARPY